MGHTYRMVGMASRTVSSAGVESRRFKSRARVASGKHAERLACHSLEQTGTRRAVNPDFAHVLWDVPFGYRACREVRDVAGAQRLCAPCGVHGDLALHDVDEL